MSSFAPFAVVGLLAYLGLVRLLRFRRASSTPRRYGMQAKYDYANMSADQAQSILHDLAELEFPRFYSLSIFFALFKTYGIPSISSLLVSTRELSDTSTMSKRTADTGILLLETCLNRPSTDRSRTSLARINYLHSLYRKSGRMTDDDMLYTLSLFALEPVRWIRRFEWREMTEVELCAQGTLWKAMGDAMEVSYSRLPFHKSGWRDGLQWLEEVTAWSVRYESEHMVPADSNKRLSNRLIEHTFIMCPRMLLPFMKQMVSIILGDRVRLAMGLPSPSPIFEHVFKTVLNTRKFVLRYLMLPRPDFLRKHNIHDMPDPRTGKYHAIEWVSHPWYVQPTVWQRWSPLAMLRRLLGGKVPGDDGDSYAPEGYSPSALGPKTHAALGGEFMLENMKSMNTLRFGGCPFTNSANNRSTSL